MLQMKEMKKIQLTIEKETGKNLFHHIVTVNMFMLEQYILNCAVKGHTKH